MRIYFQIVINHASEQTPTIILHTATQKYMFNCSENFMRFQKHHRIKCQQGMNIFLTRLSSETLDGLHPNVTNLFGTGMAINDKVYGPSKTIQMFQAMKTKYYIKSIPFSFVGFDKEKPQIASPSMDNYLLGITDMDQIYNLMNDIDFPLNYFESHTAANKFFLNKFKEQAAKNKDFFNDARKMINPNGYFQDKDVEIVPIYVQTTEEDVLAYLIKFPTPPMKMNKEKLKALNIPGKMMKEFQQNGQIELNGKLIKLEDVMEEQQTPPNVLIFDCISENCVKALTADSILPKKGTKDSQMYAVIHMTSIQILKSEAYSTFLKTFDNDCLHIFVNSHLTNAKQTSNQSKTQNEPFLHIQANNRIAQEFPDNFPLIGNSSSYKKSEVEFILEDVDSLFPYLGKKTIAQENYELVVFPKSEERYQPIFSSGPVKKVLLFEEFESAAKQTKEFIQNKMASANEFQSLESLIKQRTKDYDPNVYFLGTTCMMPTTFRNNSSILIYEKQKKQAIMLDCGEGTYYQLLNQFGEAECQEVLKNLKLMVLTHAHSDHYMGFQGIVYQRQKALELARKENSLDGQDHTLYIALPWCLAPWFAALNNFTEKMDCKIIYIQEYSGEHISSLFAEYKKDEFSDKELQKDEENENGDVSEDDGLVKKNSKQEEEVEEEHKCSSQQKNEDEEEEEDGEEDNRGHKATVRAAQLISFLHSTEEDIKLSIDQFKQFISLELGLKELSFIPVYHCSQAYGVVFQHESGVKISYSGDTRPCPEFAKAAEESDLLIHEGTFNHDLLEHAKKARHSTVQEAIDIGFTSKAKAFVLTHVSKRHSKLNLGDFSDLSVEKNKFIQYQTSLSLDHLQFKLSEYFTVPYKSRCVHSIFPDQD